MLSRWSTIILLGICLGSPVVRAADPVPLVPSKENIHKARDLLRGLNRSAPSDRRASLQILEEFAPLLFDLGAVPRLVKLAQSDPDTEVRELTLRLLGAIGPRAGDLVIPVTLELIQKSQPGRVRGWAAYALGKMKPPVKLVAKPLIPLLLLPDDFLNVAVQGALLDMDDKVLVLMYVLVLKTKEDYTRRKLIRAIAAFESRAAELVPELLRLHKESDSQRVRDALLDAVLRIMPGDSPEVRELLTAELAKARGYRRFSLIHRLSDMGPKAQGALPLLADFLKSKDKDLPERALGAIAAIVTPETAGDLASRVAPFLSGEYWTSYKAADALARMGSSGRARLLQACGHENERVRKFAWLALAKMKPGPEGLLDALAVRFQSEDSVQVREAIGTMIATYKAGAVPVLSRLLEREQSAQVRSSLVSELAGCGPGGYESLRRALADPASQVAHSAAHGLGKLGPAAAGAVPEILALKSERTLGDTVKSIRDIGPAALPALVAALSHEQAPIRTRAAYAMGLIGEAAAGQVRHLTPLLFDPHPEVRRWTAWSLGCMGPKASWAIEDLQAALLDDDSSVREFAARSLGEIGPASQQAVPDLIRLLADKRSFVAEKAAKALAELGPLAQAAVPELIRVLAESDSEYPRRAAAKALGALGKKSAAVRQALRTALGDKKARVRWAAGEALLKVGQSEDYGAARRVIKKSPDEAFEEDAQSMRRFNEMLKPPPAPKKKGR